MINQVKLPVYSKLAQIVLGIIGLFYILFIGQEIIIPIIFSVIIAILLNPVVNYLCSKNIGKVVSIFIALFLVILLIGALLYFLGAQISLLSDSWPEFKEKFFHLLDDATQWISQTFNISHAKITGWVKKTKAEGVDSSVVIGQTLNTLKSLVVVFLLPVYVFMILFYKPLLLDFIAQLFKHDKHEIVGEVLTETKSLIQNYLVGLLIEAAIVATLNSVGLMIIGIQYAILLGILGALLNIIPYIGGLIAIALPMLVAIATKSPSAALWVLIVYLVVQFIDNHYIVPSIVASKVKINALVSIIVVLVGGALWGVPGMFLSIPLTAIIKVIFDRIEPLKPFGFLLGDNQPEIGRIKIKRSRTKKETAS